MVILIFFVVHWQVCVFCQSFFLHRYSAHKQFTMSPGWERFFYLFTYIAQGSSFLNPRGYAILHRMHHAYSDTEKDPHSPLFATDALSMMLKTKHEYDDFAYRRREPEPRFAGDYPEWDFIDKLGQSWVARLGWVGIYAVIYFQFATSPWLFLLLPVQAVVGPVHGAIVNWCGHKYGYSNFNNNDHSKNTVPVDIFLMGELMQNNHHKSPNNINFAKKRFEFDPTFPLVILMDRLGIIHLRKHE
jgi:stearoyl-CoA desaturase (delta-9 desaturase)